MATILEYAYLANDVYRDDIKNPHQDKPFTAVADTKVSCMLLPWIGLLDSSSEQFDSKDDFFARLYANTITHETVIAYRGTVPSKMGDIKADLKLTVKRWNSQDEQARNFYSWAKSYLNSQQSTSYSKFPSITGHSLGGYLAQVVGVEHPELLVVVFNAPGIGNSIDPYVGYINPLSSTYKKNIYNYDLSTDGIHDVGMLIGNKKILNGDFMCSIVEHTDYLFGIPGIYCYVYKEHSMLTVISILKNNPSIANKTPKI